MDDENKIPEPAQAPEPAQPASPADARDSAQDAAQPAQPQADPAVAQPAQPQADPAVAQPSVAPQQPTQPYSAPQQPTQPYGAAPQQPTQPYYQPGQPSVQPYASPSNGKAIGALICGILAILFSWLPLLGVILGVVAIVLAVQVVKKSGKDGKATGGKVCGIVGIVLSVIAFIFYLVVGIGTAALLNESRTGFENVDTNPPIEDSSSADDSSAMLQEADEEAAKSAVDEALSEVASLSDADIQEIADAFDEGFAEGSGFSMSELGVDPVLFIEWAMGDFDYTIEDAFITGDSGWVDVTAEVRDLYEFSVAFDEEITAYMETEEYQNMTDEAALKAKLGELLLAAMDKTTGTAESYLMIDVEKTGDTWVVDPSSLEDELLYLFSF